MKSSAVVTLARGKIASGESVCKSAKGLDKNRGHYFGCKS